jgi:hypothetical protein
LSLVLIIPWIIIFPSPWLPKSKKYLFIQLEKPSYSSVAFSWIKLGSLLLNQRGRMRRVGMSSTMWVYALW